MHAVWAVVDLSPAMQMRATPKAVGSNQRQTTGERQREPLPAAVIGWICIQEGASGITARGTVLGELGNMGCACCILRERECDCVCMGLPPRGTRWTCATATVGERGFGTPRVCGLSASFCRRRLCVVNAL